MKLTHDLRAASRPRGKKPPEGDLGGRRGLLAPKLGQRVLKRLDQALRILRRHLDPVGRDMRAIRVFGRVLHADERLAVHDAGADAGELEGEGRGHGYMAAQKQKAPKGGFMAKYRRSKFMQADAGLTNRLGSSHAQFLKAFRCQPPRNL